MSPMFGDLYERSWIQERQTISYVNRVINAASSIQVRKGPERCPSLFCLLIFWTQITVVLRFAAREATWMNSDSRTRTM